MDAEMKQFLRKLHSKCDLAIVSGSDYIKIKEQVDDNELMTQLDYVFSENGLVAIKSNNIIGKQSISKYLGEDILKQVINFCLKYISELDIPIKRGNFIEYRSGMLNVSPIGRNCSQEERIAFFEYDKVLNYICRFHMYNNFTKTHQIRAKFVNAMKEHFKGVDITFSIGGQISIDIFPTGWDKTFCLRFMEGREIHFFGDRVEKGGNDYEIYIHPSVIPHKVVDPNDTILQLTQLFLM